MNAPVVRALCSALLLFGLTSGTSAAAVAQQATVTGVVTDQATGQPLSDARVVLVGTTFLQSTNAEGRYRFVNVSPGQVTVRASFIGYAAGNRTVTVGAGETATVDLALTQAPFTLDARVVTATGEQARRELGNAVSTLRTDSLLRQAPAATLGDLLVGKAAGVQVLPGNMTGGESRVRIRGTNSISLGNDPIYYIDGIRMESARGSTSIGIGGTEPQPRERPQSGRDRVDRNRPRSFCGHTVRNGCGERRRRHSDEARARGRAPVDRVQRAGRDQGSQPVSDRVPGVAKRFPRDERDAVFPDAGRGRHLHPG